VLAKAKEQDLTKQKEEAVRKVAELKVVKERKARAKGRIRGKVNSLIACRTALLDVRADLLMVPSCASITTCRADASLSWFQGNVLEECTLVAVALQPHMGTKPVLLDNLSRFLIQLQFLQNLFTVMRVFWAMNFQRLPSPP
jgi:hypothetical protein